MSNQDVSLSPVETAVLMMLAEEPGLTVGELGHALVPYRLQGNHKFAELHGTHYVAMASNAVQVLERLGFVSKGAKQ